MRNFHDWLFWPNAVGTSNNVSNCCLKWGVQELLIWTSSRFLFQSSTRAIDYIQTTNWWGVNVSQPDAALTRKLMNKVFDTKFFNLINFVNESLRTENGHMSSTLLNGTDNKMKINTPNFCPQSWQFIKYYKPAFTILVATCTHFRAQNSLFKYTWP
jgi:hypothetical protein